MRTLQFRPGSRELTIADILAVAPSVGATEAHESRSSRYTHIPTIRVVEGMMAEGFVPVMAQQSHTRLPGKAGFAKHLLRFRHMSGEAAIGAAVREVVLINSHDGSSAYNLMAGLFRMVCLNGLIVGDNYASIKVPHKGDVVGQVIEGAYEVLTETKRASEQAESWAGIQLDRGEQLAFAHAAHQVRFPALPDETEGERIARVPLSPERLIDARRMADMNRSDLWTTMNVVQENAVRGGQRMRVIAANGRRRRASTREVSGIDQSTALNRALWSLTEHMASIKAAA